MARTATTRQGINNIVINGDFEFAPTFTAPTTTSGRFIDGTATGSLTDNQYGWSFNGTAGSSAQFDSTVSYTGTTSLKISTTATGAYTENFYKSLSGGLGGYFGKSYLKVLPLTSYTVSYRLKTNYISGDSSDGASLVILESNAAGTTASAQTTVGTKVKTTIDWTLKTATFTTSANTQYLQINPLIYGHTGAGTLIMDAWFDNIQIGLTTPVTRGVA